jgi:hypothetical protein
MGSPYGLGMKKRYPGAKFNQFAGAEMIAERWGFTRETLDRFGLASHQKAAAATREGRFAREIAPVEVTLEDGSTEKFAADEGIRADASLDAMAALKPLSDKGLLTAGTSSQITDGAAAVLVANEAGLARLGATPRARIAAMALAGDDPVIMLTAPIPATKKLLARSVSDRSDRPLRGQRGVRLGSARVAARHRSRPGEAQRERRGDRARPSARLHGREARDHAAARARAHERALRAADDVRGRRARERDADRARVAHQRGKPPRSELHAIEEKIDKDPAHGPRGKAMFIRVGPAP